jgi:OFA family oxalate/formate antiporter-like MFS transporter
VFLGWGLGAFMPRLAGTIRDATGSFNAAFYLSAALLVGAFILALVTRRPAEYSAKRPIVEAEAEST